MKLSTAILASPLLALIVWYCVNHVGYSVSYWLVLIALLVAKLTALFLQNEPPILDVTVSSEKR